MPNPQILHPSSAVPLAAMSFGETGDIAKAVSPANPLPTLDRPYRGARALVANTAIAAGSAVLVDCLVAGTVQFEFADSGAGVSTVSITIPAGLAILPFAAQRFLSAGSTANFNAWVLD